MDFPDNPGGPSRRKLLGGFGLAGAASFAGSTQLANFVLGSPPAMAQDKSKPLNVAVVAPVAWTGQEQGQHLRRDRQLSPWHP